MVHLCSRLTLMSYHEQFRGQGTVVMSPAWTLEDMDPNDLPGLGSNLLLRLLNFPWGRVTLVCCCCL